MERQQVKRKLNMIKVDMDTRAMLASNQQKMCVVAFGVVRACVCMYAYVCSVHT